MLAHPTKSITKVLDRVEGHKFTCEFKYDGERGQVNNNIRESIKYPTAYLKNMNCLFRFIGLKTGQPRFLVAI